MPEPTDVYYDAECALCRAAAARWARAGEGAALRMLPLQGDLPAGAPDRTALRTALHVRNARGWQSGARALLTVYRQLPGGGPMALALRIGIALGIAEPAYRLLARHRLAWRGRRRRGEQRDPPGTH